MKVKILIAVLLLLIIIVIMSFAGMQSSKFYYSYNEKIYLTELENKLIIRYKQNKNSDIKQISLSAELIDKHIQWKDDSTFIITLGVAEKELYQERILKQSDVKSCNPVYCIDKGLEVGLTDEFVVGFNKNVSKDEIRNIHNLYGVEVLKTTDYYQLLQVPSGSNALEIANKYQESGLLLFSHPNFISDQVQHQIIPTDPYFVNQFYLNNTGQVFTDGHSGFPDADIDAPEAWSITLGNNNIVIAVIDEGVTSDHTDLPNARQIRINGSNFADGDVNNPSPTGNYNHGNACAGIIGASHNIEGISGIAPLCRILPIRKFNSNGSGITPEKNAAAIDFARLNGAVVISNSWGYNSDNPNLYPIIKQAIINATTIGRNNLGCVVVYSSSNSANHNISQDGYISFPGNVDVAGVLTVGASDRNDLQANYSPTSIPTSPNNQLIDIVSPSHRAYSNQTLNETFEVWSIDIPNDPGYNSVKSTDGGTLPVVGSILPNSGVNHLSYTARFGGTSAACPQVAAVAALMLSINPNLTQQQVYNIMTSSTDHGTHYTYTNGRSNELGYGRLNAFRALSQTLLTVCTTSGPALVCSSPNSTFSLNNRPPGTTVQWTKSSNLEYVSGNGTDNYIVRASSSNGIGWVQPTIYFGTEPVVLPQYPVWAGAPQSPSITASLKNWGSYYEMRFFATQIDDVTYQWKIDGDIQPFYGPFCSYVGSQCGGDPALIFRDYNVEVSVINNCDTTTTCRIFRYSCGYSPSISFIGFCGGGGYEEMMEENDISILVAPNPANDNVKVSIYKKYYRVGNALFENKNLNLLPALNKTYRFRIISSSGLAVYSSKLTDNSITISTSGLINGPYIIEISDGIKAFNQQLMIKH